MKVCGLDLSLTGSGVAVVEWFPAHPGGTPGVRVEEYGSRPTTADLAARGARLRKVATPVISRCQNADLVMVEDLFMGAGTGAQLDRAGLWWIIVNSLTAAGVPVVPVTNNHLKMLAVGKGGGAGTDKAHVIAACVKRYGHLTDINSDNCADALVLADAGARHLGFPLTDLPETHLRGQRAIKFP